jgi:predicted DCC family thiol-disulfide oxidoreductase YuxK
LLKSRRGFACQRLIQFQMAVIYFYAGVEKLTGNLWWIGEAPWYALNNNEVAFIPMGLFAEHFWLINLVAFGTIFLEISYPFLIWGKKTRPYFLVAAFILHAGIAVFMGMYYFASFMVCGHITFMRRGWYEAAGRWWRERTGAIEMIYDGDCGFCKKSMALFLAFDGLQQITTRNYHVSPSAVVSSEAADKALYTVTSDNKTFPGFEAYRYVVVRAPGMWWFAPLFYIPVLSRAIGHPVYSWVASHRMMLSKYFFKPNGKSQCAVEIPATDDPAMK